MDTVLGVLAYIAGVELAVVLGMIAAPHYVRVGKLLLLFAAIPFGIWGFIWMNATDAPLPVRLAVGILIGLFVFVAVPETIRWLNLLPAAEGPKNPPPAAEQPKQNNIIGDIKGNSGIVTQGQQGDNIQLKK